MTSSHAPVTDAVASDGTMNGNGSNYPSVTAPVTDPWEQLTIPPFLRRAKPPSVSTGTGTLINEQAAPRESLSGPAVEPELPNRPMMPAENESDHAPPPDDFAKFRVDPGEIETRIKVEADRRWRSWMPTKIDRKRPRKSWYERQVRKEFYP